MYIIYDLYYVLRFEMPNKDRIYDRTFYILFTFTFYCPLSCKLREYTKKKKKILRCFFYKYSRLFIIIFTV